MPLKFNVGITKKIGLPDYGSVGASCHVEVELDESLAEGDLEHLHLHVRRAYVACAQAVNDELARQMPTGTASVSRNGATSGNGSRTVGSRPAAGPRRATQAQVRAIHAIAERQGLDLVGLLNERFGASDPAELTITDASHLIDELKGSANGARGQR